MSMATFTGNLLTHYRLGFCGNNGSSLVWQTVLTSMTRPRTLARPARFKAPPTSPTTRIPPVWEQPRNAFSASRYSVDAAITSNAGDVP